MSSTPRPETYDPSSRSRPEVFPWVFAAAGIAAAIGSIAYVTQPVEDEPPIVVQAQMSPVSPKRAAVQREVTPEQTAPEAAGVDIGSIPLDQADSRKLGRSAAQVAQEAARPPKANNDKPPVEKVVLAEATRPAKANNDKPSAEKIVLAEEPQVVLEETPENPDGTAQAARSQVAPAAPPPAAEALEKVPQGPFNRGQALSQLGASANRANGCRRPGGPSGAGRATITFGNDGAAKGVVVSAPFAGTPVGACVTSAFKSSRVPPFTGSPVTLPWSFRIAE